MSRAQGKRTPRWVGLEELLGGGGQDHATEGERREAGATEDERVIPGGLNHLANPPVKTQAVPVPAQDDPYRRSLLAHGVLPDGKHHDRDPRLAGGQRGQAKMAPAPPKQTPVPVYIVEGRDATVIKSASPRSVQCPASTSAEPVRVCGRAPDRIEIQVLNEDTTTDIRFATNLAPLAAGNGALLPWPSNTYLALPTQGELYAIGASGTGTPRLSIIEVFEDELGA